MRVSDGMRLDAMTQQMSTLSQQQVSASKIASTGLRINAPSDDPVAAAQQARVQASLDATDGYRTAIRNVRGDVELSETTLASATDTLQSAQDLAMQGANGSLAASDRTALASQVSQLHSSRPLSNITTEIIPLSPKRSARRTCRQNFEGSFSKAATSLSE